MKTALKKSLVLLLSAVLLLPLGLLAAAENGPNPNPVFEDMYLTYLILLELDENGEPVLDEEGFFKEIRLFGDNTVFPNEKASYDLKTNTLTLTDLNDQNYVLEANMMGDDFTIRVKGDNRLACITVWGDGWGGSLHITGDGALTVNGNKTEESGIVFYPEGAERISFTVDASVKLNVYGSETAIQVFGADVPFRMTVGNTELQIPKTKAVRQEGVWIDGYSNPTEQWIAPCRNAADPDGLYSMMTWYDSEEHTKMINVTVERFVYLEKYDRYVRDYDWAEANGGDYDVEFPDAAAAAAAGFTPILDANGEAQWEELKVFGNYGSEMVLVDFKGDEYVAGYDFDEHDNLIDIAMTIEPIDEMPGKYVFTYTPDVNPDDLLEKIETVTYDDMFDYAFPDKEFELHIDTSVLLGDVNGDGHVGADDARYALRAAVELDDTAEGLDFSSPANRCYIAADVDGTPGIGAADARLILRAAVGLETLG